MNSSSYNFTIDDSSSFLTYFPYSDGSSDGGWETWFSVSGFNSQGGEEGRGDSRHITAFPGATVSLQFHGTAVYLYGNSTCAYDVALDGGNVTQSSGSGDLLFSQVGLPLGVHSLNLTAQPTTDAPGVLSFDGAIVTDVLPTGSIVPLVIDNQDNSTLKYTGNWTDKLDPQIPNRTDPKPFKQTESFQSSVSMEFNNVVAIAVNGSKNWGHWTYSVKLDNTTTLYNASTWWLVGDAVLFYQSGLDPNQTHSLKITNQGGNGLDFTLNEIILYKFNGMTTNSTSAPVAAATSHSKKVGVIVGPIVAVVVVAIALLVFVIYWRKRRAAQRPSIGDIAPFPPTSPDQQNGEFATSGTFVTPAAREKSSKFLESQPRPTLDSVPNSFSPPSSAYGIARSSPGSHASREPGAGGSLRDAQSPQAPSSVYHSAPSSPNSGPGPAPRMAFDNQVDINRIVELVAQRIDRPPVDSDSSPPPEYPVS